MQEFKREKQSLESRVNQISKAATHHNDHLRVIDSWFKQVGNSSVPVHTEMAEANLVES